MKRLKSKIGQYHFELRHLLVLVLVIILFQIILSYIHSISVQNVISKTMELYRQDSAERIAHQTATALEVLLDQSLSQSANRTQIVQSINIILSQQLLQKNVDEVAILVEKEHAIHILNDGDTFFDYIFHPHKPMPAIPSEYKSIERYYLEKRDVIVRDEQIITRIQGSHEFHVLVPFVPKGEYIGALYIKMTPDIRGITEEISTVYSESGALFTALILFGLLAMYYISSFTVKERDYAMTLLFREREGQMRQRIIHEKESQFTRRIYHAHHKAEKIMGFINEEIRALTRENLEAFKYKVSKYARFVSRVIYDMKSADPPIHAIRGPMFQTNINMLISFLTEHIFMRVFEQRATFRFQLDLDANFPIVNINEFVIWQILEPIIQNSIDHNPRTELLISIKTDAGAACGAEISIADNGRGIAPEFLENDPQSGIQKLFNENISSKPKPQEAGYGCYIAYGLAAKRCGWKIKARNLPEGGCQFIICLSK
ncbi:MAG TPA: ATP-binding protein [Candidatus Marinimicrobia bacterium]|nr:ATP-binding protein [Candidatus Neomarinimicrobiota bacterium]